MLTVSLFVQTSEEVSEKMTGLLVPMNSERSFTMALDDQVSKLPKSVDYRKKGMVTAVKNQVRDHLVQSIRVSTLKYVVKTAQTTIIHFTVYNS